jgi:lysozyme
MSPRKQKKIFRRILFSFILLILVSLGGWFFYNWLEYRKAKQTRYPEFGITIPDNYFIHGIDVSRYQDIIAWEEVQKMNVKNIRLGFAFIKATEGIGNDDPQFNRNWKKAKANGIIRGAYHFFIATKDGKMQAENFIKKVDTEAGDLPPVLDVEHTYGLPYEEVRKEVRKWLATVEGYYKIKPIIYTNVDFYNRCLGEEFDSYPLWVAHYYEPYQPRIKRGWVFWQHSDEGRVNGIIPKVDFNVFAGDSIEIRNLLVK